MMTGNVKPKSENTDSEKSRGKNGRSLTPNKNRIEDIKEEYNGSNQTNNISQDVKLLIIRIHFLINPIFQKCSQHSSYNWWPGN